MDESIDLVPSVGLILLKNMRTLKNSDIFDKPILTNPEYSTALRDRYRETIERPMDYFTIETKMSTYTKFKELEDDLNLIYDNCLQFNGSKGPDVTFYKIAAFTKAVLLKASTCISKYMLSILNNAQANAQLRTIFRKDAITLPEETKKLSEPVVSIPNLYNHPKKSTLNPSMNWPNITSPILEANGYAFIEMNSTDKCYYENLVTKEAKVDNNAFVPMATAEAPIFFQRL